MSGAYATVRRAARSAVVRYRHAGVKASDVVITSYPKAGSSWVRFMLAGALTGEDMDFDRIRTASPPLGALRGSRAIVPGGGRLVKSHEHPAFVLGVRPKVICLVRDGRDVGVSYYHHMKRKGAFDGEIDAFIERFIDGRVSVFGSWQGHVRSWLDYSERTSRPFALVRYEDVLADPAGALRRISDTVELELSDAAIEAAIVANDTTSMRQKESTSTWLTSRSTAAIPFVRAAGTGGWREVFTPEATARFDAAAGAELAALGYQRQGG